MIERPRAHLVFYVLVVVMVVLAAVAVFLLRPGGPVEEARERGAITSPTPDPSLLTSASIVAARQSVLRVVGIAPSCSRRIEGSAFVYAPERVMTAAHVVAGVVTLDVETPADGLRHPADVVLYDPRHDIAVLRVPGLTARPLLFAPGVSGGQRAVVAGYPGRGGPLTLLQAWIEGRKPVAGPNIYNIGQVTRMIYAVGAAKTDRRGLIEPGDSGGPLLAADGSVYGMVFAAEQKNPNLGYAMAVSELTSAAAAGRTATQPVSTQACTS